METLNLARYKDDLEYISYIWYFLDYSKFLFFYNSHNLIKLEKSIDEEDLNKLKKEFNNDIDKILGFLLRRIRLLNIVN